MPGDSEERDFCGAIHDFRAEIYDGFNWIENGFVEMRAKFDLAAAGQQQIVGLIQGLIDDRGDNSR